MSVILTAGKRLNKPKSAKPKKKKSHASQVKQFNPNPPVSSEKTTVWHWPLNNIPTTVMYSKENQEVWCNGEVLETDDGFGDSADDAGYIIDFCICLDETNSVHKARIMRVSSGQQHCGIMHLLYVDGQEIPEHTPDAMNPADNTTVAPDYDLDDPPPQYDEHDNFMAMYDGLDHSDVNGAYGTPPPPYYEDPNDEFDKKNK